MQFDSPVEPPAGVALNQAGLFKVCIVESSNRRYPVATPKMSQGILLQPHPLGDLPGRCQNEEFGFLGFEVTCQSAPLIGADQHLLSAGQPVVCLCSQFTRRHCVSDPS